MTHILIFLTLTTGTINMQNNTDERTIILGGGCFWCIEAIYNTTKGVLSATSGYAGGLTTNPTYDEVCSGASGHAEVVKINYDSKIISLQEILDIFFTIHDPSQLNRQGADVGTQYRSIIFYNTKDEKTVIENYITDLREKGEHQTITTIVEPTDTFYKAEISHQNYYERNQFAPYCTYVIKPKMRKFKNKFKNAVKNPNEQ